MKGILLPKTFGLVGDFHNPCTQTDIDGIKEITAAVFFSIIEITVSYVYFLQPVVDDTVNSRLILSAESPVFGKIVPDTVRYKAEGDILFIFGIGQHDTVDGIVQCTVTAHNDNRAIAVVLLES